MDIEKEREAFDQYFKEKYQEFHNEVFDENGDDRAIIGYSFAWSAWQAAKAQVVPEGFILVEKTKLMQIVGSAAIIEPITRGNPLMSKYKTELDFILSTVRAMIEAQEQKG